ncbi:DUF1349 domain-containing protein [Tessaracoccus sp. OS52]|uniref:DUF1349 domain-containing protein n=1 Tax=Tessaracoccus sp. OS52 TaxID=2886691 RepID=UPI001D0F6CDE|nr:DUF1349 domain-containing protein [Tessaracoccus sp. OS52]MCC2592930.1 DUF1349 domain-containing protein [Tessaracoccus sp. OS52]
MTDDFRGTWTHQPAAVERTESGLRVTAVEGSDAWRLTSYGFIHDSEHALLADLAHGNAVQVSFSGDFTEQFDQAGIFLRASEKRWVKAGVEFSDGVLQLGAVVTDEYSDWSLAPVPDWHGHEITIRASWADDALTIRARVGQEPFRLVRVLPFSAELDVQAGPLVCAPTRAGLVVTFTGWEVTAPDDALH